jgi:hypothetical protein
MAKTVRALGAHCTAKALYFAVAENGTIAAAGVQKVEVPDGLRAGASLAALAAELRCRLAEISATRAALLMPRSYRAPNLAVARLGAETLLRLIAADHGLEVELLHRATARTRLGIGQTGSLDARIAVLFPTPVGEYWAEGRRYAAFAALACENRAN